MTRLSEAFELFGKKVPMLELPIQENDMAFGDSVVFNPKFIESFRILKRWRDDLEPSVYITMQSGKEYQLAITVQELGEKLISLGII